MLSVSPLGPRSATLFPYTTLSDLGGTRAACARRRCARRGSSSTSSAITRRSPSGAATTSPSGSTPSRARSPTPPRSEEHTSELQSRQYHVCHLPLENTSNLLDGVL